MDNGHTIGRGKINKIEKLTRLEKKMKILKNVNKMENNQKRMDKIEKRAYNQKWKRLEKSEIMTR